MLYKPRIIFWSYLQTGLEYRGILSIWLFDSLFFPIVMIFIWQTIASTNPQLFERIDQIAIYYLFLPLITMIGEAWHSRGMAREIRLGELNSKLVKPLPIYNYYLWQNLAEKLIRLFILVPSLVIAFWWLDLTIDFKLEQLPWFVLALFLGLFLNIFLESLIGLLAFWLEDISSIQNFSTIAEFTLGGRVVPLFLFPLYLKNFAIHTPFRYITSFPLEILTGSISIPEIIYGLSIAAGWIFGLGIIANLLWIQGIKKYSAAGG